MNDISKKFKGQTLSKDKRPILQLTLKKSVPVNSNTLEDGTMNPQHFNPGQVASKKKTIANKMA